MGLPYDLALQHKPQDRVLLLVPSWTSRHLLYTDCTVMGQMQGVL
jgi:hypothetical protein